MTQDFCPTCGLPDGAGHTNQECFEPPAPPQIFRGHPGERIEFDCGPWWELALLRWMKYAQDPGDCLRAILTNDLFGAYERADEFTKADMDLIVKFIYNKLPWDCWGSKERVSTWKGL